MKTALMKSPYVSTALASLLMSMPLYAVEYDSSYSSISEENCRLVEFIEEGGSTVSSCPAHNEIKVQLMEGDLRQSLNLIRKGKEYPLNLWSSGFSELGSLIEWRHKKKHPEDTIGLIVRLNIAENPDNSKKTTSYLVVAKVTADRICTIGKILPKAGMNQNQQARKLVESSASRLCLDDPRMVLNGLVFQSKNKYIIGGDTEKRHWKISFQGEYYSWEHSGIVESGSFTMSDNGEIKIRLLSKKSDGVSGAYDGSEQLSWKGIQYNLVKK